MAVRVVCDSTAYLTPELLARHNIALVSLSVLWANKSVLELDITDLDAFYDELHAMKEMPTTSQPSVGQFLEVYRPMLENGDDIVSVHLSAAISGTWQSANQARDQLEREGYDPRRITVLDSRSAAGGLAVIALAAAGAASAGETREEVAAAAERMANEMSFWWALDTLEFLKRGGRIGGAQALFASAMKVKPILSIDETGTIPVDKVRTQSRALDRLVELAEQNMPAGGRYAVQHIGALDLANDIVARCKAKFDGEPVFVNEIGPVLGVHAGRGLIGIAVMPADLIR
ncbi:MAG: DegV family protein [Thermoleophilaceae bacterium]|nr:DegV family protein [Thermoleophilaceae bacterium]